MGELEAWLTGTGTTALVVRVGGETVLDARDLPPFDGHVALDGRFVAGPADGVGLPFHRTADGEVVHDVASAQKSVVAVLVAMAADRGLLDVDDPVSDHLGDGWSRAGEHEGAVRLRHLLTMTSGLSDALEYEVEPGTRWSYSLGPAWHLLKKVVVAASGEALGRVTDHWLGGPLGWRHTSWIDRPGMAYLDGTPFEALASTAGDLATFGELVLAGGAWRGRRLVSVDGLAMLLRPSQDLNPAYGMLWWLNGHRPHLRPMEAEPIDDVLLPGVPDDAVLALGALEQVCGVVPSLGLVVARTGTVPGGLLDPAAGREVLADVWRLALARARPGS